MQFLTKLPELNSEKAPTEVGTTNKDAMRYEFTVRFLKEKNMNRIWLTLTLVLSFAVILKADDKIAVVKDLPALSKAESWVVEQGEKQVMELEQGDGRIVLKVKLTSKDNVRLMLKEPVDLPDKYELVWNAAAKECRPLFVYALIKDSKGKLFLFHQSSRSFCRNSMFLGGYFAGGLFRHGDVLMRVFGLRDFQRHSFAGPDKNWCSAPVPPLKFVGLELTAERERLEENTLNFWNFRLTDIDHKTSKLYYQFNNQECFSELSGLPSLSYGDILGWTGYRAYKCENGIIDWSVRNDYNGQPFMVGSEEFTFNPEIPRELEVTRHITFPITTPGTYWVNVKYRARAKGKVAEIGQNDFRLYVINGENKKLPPMISADTKIGSSTIRIAPEQKQFIWNADEKWLLPVHFSAANGTKCQVLVKDKTGKILKQQEVVGEADTVVNELDLSGLPAGIYEIEATQLKDGDLVDRSQQTIGKKEKDLANEQYKLPAGVATYEELINGKDPLFYFEPHIGNRTADENKKTMEMMNEVQPITKNIELFARWSDIERLPGLYDFSTLDESLDYARKIGTKIQLHLCFPGPEWLPSHFTQNPEGKIFGHNSYLFHGARLNMYQSELIRLAALEFVKAAVLHFRNHPALQSYYFLIEHPGEAPYKGWYEGFDKFTLRNFRDAMQKKYQKIDTANATWRTKFANFATIQPPYPNSLAANQLWLDWINFREQGVGEFREQCVDIVRKYDPKRMIMMYGHGSEKMKDRGVLTANGGCAKVAQQSLGMIEVADRGMYQRAEEISVTNWRAFPKQMEMSFYTMMMGGGGNSHCKMFFPVDKYLKNHSFEDLRKTCGFDDFEKFIPLWKELRPARSVAGDVRYFVNTHSDCVSRKSTYSGGGDSWFTMFFMNGQVPFWIAPGKDWKNSKLVVLPDTGMRVIEDKVARELADYVKDGGNLLMFASSGRYSMESGNSDLDLLRSYVKHDLETTRKMNSPENDWLLLKHFGFKPPEEPVKQNFRVTPAGVEGTALADYRKMGLLRDIWVTEEGNGKTIATGVLLGKTSPALTMKEYGKGKVFVIWACTQIPSDKSNRYENSLLRGVAEMVGADLPVETSSRLQFINLMKHKDEDIWYVLVFNNNKDEKDKPEETVKVTLPDGEYKVSELANKKSLGTLSAEKLKKEGLKNKLEPQDIAIYKLSKVK